MSYHGAFEHGVDGQRRLQVPSDWRPSREDAKFILIPWKHSNGTCIRVLTPEKMTELLAEVNAMPNDNPRKNQLKRYIGTHSAAVTLDKAGRICLPAELAESAGITTKAKLVSLLDRFEIWNVDRYVPVADDDESVAEDAVRYLA
jgi:MraZ protein